MPLRCLVALLFAILAGGCEGCRDEPEPPPAPDPVLRWHAHFGRPAASIGLMATVVQGPLDVRGLVRSIVEIPDGVFEVVDLMQPLDVMLLDAEGTRHLFAVYAAAPNAAEALGESFTLEPVTHGNKRIVVDGETRCMLMETRIACADSVRGMGAMVLFAKRRADKWKDDKSDAVVSLSGDALRDDLDLPVGPKADALIAQLLEALRNAAPGIEELRAVEPKADFVAWFEGIDAATLRLRLTARSAVVDARVDSATGAPGALPGLTRAIAKARPRSDAARVLPQDASVALAFGGATPAPRRQLLRRALGLRLAPDAAEPLPKAAAWRDQLAVLWAATGGPYALAHRPLAEGGEIYEVHGLHDPKAAAAALDALDGRPIALDERPQGKALDAGDSAFAFGIIADQLVVIASPEADRALAAAAERQRGKLERPMSLLAQKPLAITADLGALLQRQASRVHVGLSPGQPEGAGQQLAVAVEVTAPALRLLHLMLSGGLPARETTRDERGAVRPRTND